MGESTTKKKPEKDIANERMKEYCYVNKREHTGR